MGAKGAVDAALESARGLAGELVPAAHPGHDIGREVGGLEGDVGGLIADLGVRAAHGAGQADGAAVVSNRQIVGGQFAFDVVDGLELLPRLGPSSAHGSLQGIEVEGVQWLAEFEHDVVRDVDGEGHRAHAAIAQSIHYPLGGGNTRIDPGDGAQGEQWTCLEVIGGAVRRCALVGRAGQCLWVLDGIVVIEAVGDRDLTGDAASA